MGTHIDAMRKLKENRSLKEETKSFEDIIYEMEISETYEELRDAASYIEDVKLKNDVYELIDQCEKDGDDVEVAYSVVTSDLLDGRRNDLNESLKDSRTIDKPYESTALKNVKFANPEANTGKKSVDMKQTDHKDSESIKKLTSTEFKNPEKNNGKLKEAIKLAKESLQDNKTIEDPHYSDAVKELTSVKFADPEKNVGKLKESKNLKEGIISTLDEIADKASELGYEVMDDENDEGKTILVYKPESTEEDNFDDYDNSELYDYLATISNVRYQVDNNDPSTLAIWIKELDEKKLTELRHVDKLVTVVGYDFSELSETIQNDLLSRYYRKNSKDSKPKSLKEMVADDVKEKLSKEIKEKYGFDTKIYLQTFDKPDLDGSIRVENREFDPAIFSQNLKSEYYGNDEGKNSIGEVSGYLDDSYSSLDRNLIERLKQYTNYTELPKSEKREILGKISQMREDLKDMVAKARAKYDEDLKNYGDSSMADFDKIQNKKAIEELSKYWYDKNGSRIVSKDNAKVVDLPKDEAKKLTEAPVGLEFDQGYDLYNYDDLDDYAKNNVFNNSERARKNLYDKNLSVLQDRVKSLVNEDLNKVGLKVDTSRGVDIRSYDRGEISGIYIVLDQASLLKYAKDNGIEVGDKTPSATVIISKGGMRGWSLDISIAGLSEQYHESPEEKQLREELVLDLEGLPRKIFRLVKQFETEMDDEFKNKLSTDRKYKRREYDRLGNVYKGND